jgi:hypothetical protein
MSDYRKVREFTEALAQGHGAVTEGTRVLALRGTWVERQALEGVNPFVQDAAEIAHQCRKAGH